MKLKYNFTIQEVVGMYMAVSVGDDRKFDGVLRFNETGKRIFELIQEGLDEDSIVATLQQEYDASDDVLRTEVKKIVDQLQAENLFED